MNVERLSRYIDTTWDQSIVPALSEYIRIPNKSVHFDPQWEQHGHMQRAAQLTAFRRQLDLAVQLRKPVFLHQRDAHEGFLAVLREYGSRLVGGVAHCFTSGIAEARAYLDLGLYIGITGWISDERRGLHLREVVRTIPAERLLIETDGPYLLPRDLQPKPQSRRNEPMYLPHVLRAIATARGESPQELASLTTRNAHTLFGWPAPAAESLQ